MPELPEVECTVRFLAGKLKGRSIKQARVGWERIIVTPKLREFLSRVKNSKFISFERRGKYIVLKLSGAKSGAHYLISHLRMSGSYDVVKASALRSKHDHVIFTLDDGRELRFHDIRKFGRIYLVKDKEQVLSKLGLEPLSREFKPADFYAIFRRYKTPIKTILLRQELISGVGNIYADESLWAAKIHPRKPANKLTIKQTEELVKELRRILREAIKCAGTDNGDGVVYGGMYRPRAYGRAGEECLRCGSALRRIIVAQRGTSFCPKCQRI